MDNLTDAEKALIVHALRAVAPTGGGSRQYRLACKLAEAFGLEVDYLGIGLLMEIAYREVKDFYTEYGVIPQKE